MTNSSGHRRPGGALELAGARRHEPALHHAEAVLQPQPPSPSPPVKASSTCSTRTCTRIRWHSCTAARLSLGAASTWSHRSWRGRRPRPSRPTVVMPCSRATSTARTRFRGRAARREHHEHVPGSADALDLPCEDLLVAVVVRDGGQRRGVGVEGDRGQGTTLTSGMEASDQFAASGAAPRPPSLRSPPRATCPPERNDCAIDRAAARRGSSRAPRSSSASAKGVGVVLQDVHLVSSVRSSSPSIRDGRPARPPPSARVGHRRAPTVLRRRHEADRSVVITVDVDHEEPVAQQARSVIPGAVPARSSGARDPVRPVASASSTRGMSSG